MKNVIKVFFFLVFLILLIIPFKSDHYEITNNIHNKINNILYKINLDNYDKIMFVAHPDDDMLFGGAELINNNYLVVCVTCGTSEIREKEFEEVMKETNNYGVSLGYPDKTNGERDNWISSYDGIDKDIKEILNYKEWSKIVTHNPDGEYGHIHHKLTSEIVSNNSDNKDILYYFNRYFTKDNIPDNLVKISDKDFNRKKEILKLYKSQESIIDNHFHTIIYERLIPYNEW